MSKTKDKHSFIETFLHNAGKYPEHSALYDDLHPKGIDNQTLLFLSSKVYR